MNQDNYEDKQMDNNADNQNDNHGDHQIDSFDENQKEHSEIEIQNSKICQKCKKTIDLVLYQDQYFLTKKIHVVLENDRQHYNTPFLWKTE